MLLYGNENYVGERLLKVIKQHGKTIFYRFYGQDYFTHSKPSQSVGGAKREIPEKKHQTTRKQNLACLTCDLS